MRKRVKTEDNPEIPIAPMIDCVFLLLVYFMVSSSLDREEWALPVALPGISDGLILDLPEEQILMIDTQGQIRMNEALYDTPEDTDLVQLTSALNRFRELSAAAGGECMVTLVPQEGVRHQRIVEVLDALQRAGIESVYFGKDPSAENGRW